MSKVFLDTCVWFELVAGANPTSAHQILQTQKATDLLNNILSSNDEIITLDIQLIELTQTIIKAKLKECNRDLKQNRQSGIGNIKQFRNDPTCHQYYSNTINVCSHAINDIRAFSKKIEIYHSDIDKILCNLIKADINDYIYYEFCQKNDIRLYTFDQDFNDFEYQYLNIL